MENRLRKVGLEEVGRWNRVAGIFRLQSAGLQRKKGLEDFWRLLDVGFLWFVGD